MASNEEGNVHSKATLAPPEWTRDDEPAESEVTHADDLARREGVRAEEASLRAEWRAAQAAEDPLAEHTAASALARFLAVRERDLDDAIELGLRALELREDSELRKDVATWLESLGEPGTAALVLRRAVGTVSGPIAAELMVRVGTLLARADDAQGASAAFEEASRADHDDAIGFELRGALLAQSGEPADRREAARAYLAAAPRRQAAGAPSSELEDLLRAFECDRTSDDVADALVAAFEERGRPQSGAEVRRAHARAVPAEARTRVLERRMNEALRRDDVLEALGAALDGSFDRDFTGRHGEAFDDVLLRAGLLEPLAARLEVRAERMPIGERSRVLESLARLFSGPLATPGRAALQYVRILAEAPGRVEALANLRAHEAAQGDRLPLVEGLVRGTASSVREGRAQCARELAALARDTLKNARLEAWALEHVMADDPEDAATAGALARLGGPLEGTDARAWRAALERELEREARTLGLSRWLLGLDLVAPDEVEARAALSSAARARGDLDEAARTTRPLLDNAELTPSAVGLAWRDAALAGDRAGRARALERIASFAAPTVGALLSAVAADDHRSLGDLVSARRAAEAACQADPGSARAVVALAQALAGGDGRTVASALERALSVGFARGDLCTALAESLEGLGEIDYAVAWTQRLVALRPGDRDAAAALLARAAAAKDSQRLADSIGWLLPQPWPASVVVELVCPALETLSTLDPQRAAVAARRALDVLGSRSPVLAGVLEACADHAADRTLLAAVVERRVATTGAAEERVGMLLRLASLRASLGEMDGAVRSLTLALRLGADPLAVEGSLVGIDPRGLSPDGELWFREARAAVGETRAALAMENPTSRRFGAHRGVAPGDDARRSAARVLRELGALRWDLAGDRRGAEDAWLRAARMAPRDGYVQLGLDLARFAGARPALERLSQLIEAERNLERSGQIAAEAARAALAVGEPLRALELSEVALQRHPMLTGAVEIAERGAVEGGKLRDLTRIYDALGERARGRFGRRAAHFRGARFFDQRGERDLALRHAALAFTAVPSEGAAFLLLSRLAGIVGDRSFAVRTVEEVADASSSTGLRAAWLLRAAAVAANDEEGRRQRVDVLLKAAFLQPIGSTLALLGDAARTLLERTPDERPGLQMRFARASRALTEKLDGPDGARVALSFAELALTLFEDADGALVAVERALGTDADLDEYLTLLPFAPLLGHCVGAAETITRCVALIDKPFSNVGVPALRLLGAVALASQGPSAAARFLMLAAERESDDDELVREADRASASAEPGPAFDRFNARVTGARRVEAYLALADKEKDAGHPDLEIAALERALVLAVPEARHAIEARVRDGLERAGKGEEVEARSIAAARNEAATTTERAERWNEVAQFREGRGDVIGATAALREAAILDPKPLERWSALERVAGLAGAAAIRAQSLREIETRVPKDARGAVLRRLTQALEELGDLAAVEETWTRIHELSPEDEEADHAIEDLIVRRGDHARHAEHLSRRAKRLARSPEHRETLRVVRLRRAAILEQRLGQLDLAVAELKQLVAEWPNHESALRYLGDLLERQGDSTGALAVWSHLATLSGDDGNRASLAVRAAQAAKVLGDPGRAEELAKTALRYDAAHPDALVLLASLARERGDDASLAHWFAVLAETSTDEAERRAGRWIEASQAAARAGDPETALTYARRAAEVTPHDGGAQLFARALEYRLRGAGSPAEAKRTLDDLARIEGDLGGDDAALAAFLHAESLDVAEESTAGLRYLEDFAASGSVHPLVAAAMATRLVAQGRFVDALARFQTALTGDLLGLRSASTLALEGAEAAARAEQPELALSMLERAAADPATRETALRQTARIAASAGNLFRARTCLESLLSEGTADRVGTLAQLGRLLFGAATAQGDRNLREDAERNFRRAIEAAPADSVLQAQLRAELEVLSLPTETPSAAPPTLVDAPATVEEAIPLEVLALRIRETPPGEERARARRALARAHLASRDGQSAESLLVEGLADGDVDSGELLAQRYTEQGRIAELVRVRRQQVDAQPGERRFLEALRDAAELDRHVAYARAVDHVLRAFDDQVEPLVPPPLSSQVAQHGLSTILLRPSLDAVGEALSALWEGAGTLLSRDPSAYAITGLERVVPGSHSTIARLYELASVLLGTPNVPLYARRPPGSEGSSTGSGRYSLAGLSGRSSIPAPSVALLPTLSALLHGDLREDTTAVRYALGYALGASMPQCALLLGLPDGEVRVLWRAMFAAFGPPEHGKLGDAAAMKLVQGFWNGVPPRTQRRLQDFLARAPDDVDAAISRARQSARRTGLFLCGDFAFVARAVLQEHAPDGALATTSDLRLRCAEHGALADLLRLAVSPEYADARWRPMPEGGGRATFPSGRYRLV